jgi:hypothetical protein
MRHGTKGGRFALAVLVLCCSVTAVAADGRRVAKAIKPTSGIDRPEPPAKRQTPWLPSIIRRLISTLDDGIMPDIPHP